VDELVRPCDVYNSPREVVPARPATSTPSPSSPSQPIPVKPQWSVEVDLDTDSTLVRASPLTVVDDTVPRAGARLASTRVTAGWRCPYAARAG
jgi:hypothetical protein